MKTPRNPIVIIGAGLAGLAAGYALQQAGIPHLILERFRRPGGRATSRSGEGWIADHGCQFFRRSDTTLAALTRAHGLDDHRVTIQGAVLRMRADGSMEVPANGGVDCDRLCFDGGFSMLAERMAEPLNIRYNTPVCTIRWSNEQKVFWWDREGQVFWFEGEDGQPLRDPLTRKIVVASGVILATTATAATLIGKRSRALSEIADLTGAVEYDTCYAGLFKVPRQHVNYYALEGGQGCRLRWLAFEEMKAPERVDPEFSFIVAHPSAAWSADLMTMPDEDALGMLYAEARRYAIDLPSHPISQTYKRWHVARPLGAPLGSPDRWPVRPARAPFYIAGDYVLGHRAEDAAQSGILAAKRVVSMLPLRRAVLGIELPAG